MSIKNKVFKLLANKLYKVKVNNIENLKIYEKTIFIANHVSLLDVVILSANLPENVCFVANTHIAKRFAPFMKFRKVITIDPLNPYSIRQIIKEVNNGTPIMIFPEGRITRTGGLMKIYDGVGVIALKTNATVVPISINGAEHTKFSYLNDKNKTYYFHPVTLTIGKSFKIERDKNLSMKNQKKLISENLLHCLQNELLSSRLKKSVNLYNELLSCAKLYGHNKIICSEVNQSITYKKLIINSNVFAERLNKELAEEQNIGILLPSSIAQIVTLFSLFKLGKTPSMLNFSLGQKIIEDCCNTSSVRVILTSKIFIEKVKLHSLIESLDGKIQIIYLEDIKNKISKTDKVNGFLQYKTNQKSNYLNNEIILFTSGSESNPKGVVLSHENIFSNIIQVKSVIDFTQKDKVMNALPLFHSFGLTAGTLLPLLSGIPIVVYPTPLHYKVIPELVYDANATVIFGTATFLAAYGKNAHPHDFYSIRYVVAGAEKLKDDTRDLWMNKFGIRIIEGYGATEASPILSVNTPLLYKPKTVGHLLPGIEYKIKKIQGIETGGSLLVKGPNIMKGYLLHDKGFVPCPEWYDTGDIVDIDEQGFIEIKSRLKRFAKIAGEMISLNQVEEIVTKCFYNSEIAAIATPDNKKGEKIILYTTNIDIKLDDIRKYVKENKLSPLVIPSKIELIDKIPVMGTGKIDYITLQRETKKKVS